MPTITRPARLWPQALQNYPGAVVVAVAEGVAKGPGVQFDDLGADLRGGLDLRRVGLDEQ